MGCLNSKSKNPVKTRTIPNLTIEIPSTNYGPVISQYYTGDNIYSSVCHKYNNNIVKKIYTKSETGKQKFMNEITICKDLQRLAFIPNIFDIDEENLSFMLIQESIIDNRPGANIIQEYLSELEKFGIFYTGTIDEVPLIFDGSRHYLSKLEQIPIYTVIDSNTKSHWRYIRPLNV
jgi:hypothetical protein